MFCSACSIVNAPPEPGEKRISWLHYLGNQTFDGITVSEKTLRLIVPASYVTNAVPGPSYRKTRSRQTSPDVGIIPVGKKAPKSPMALGDIKQVLDDLQVPMVRSVVTLERPHYDAPSAAQHGEERIG